MLENTFESEMVLDFPGYDYGEALGEDMAGRRVLGTKPFDFGIGTVKISYSGVKVLVDIHVKKIAGFDPRDLIVSASHTHAGPTGYSNFLFKDSAFPTPDAPDSGVAITSTATLPGLRGSEEVLGILLSAIDSGHAVQFSHRPSRSEPYMV